MPPRAWSPGMDLGCDSLLNLGGPQRIWNQGVPGLSFGFQRWRERGERRAVRPFRKICNNPGEGTATWTSGSGEKWSVLDMLWRQS